MTVVQPWYRAVEPFDSASGERWDRYVEWSGLNQLKELVSFDGCLCPCAVKEMEARDWDYSVQEDCVLFFLTDLDYLLRRIAGLGPVNILAAVRNPESECRNAFGDARFEFSGYDIVDVNADISALTNCGGFPEAFRNEELSEVGLISEFDRAIDIRRSLREHYPDEPHAECDVWALWKMRRDHE